MANAVGSCFTVIPNVPVATFPSSSVTLTVKVCDVEVGMPFTFKVNPSSVAPLATKFESVVVTSTLEIGML